MVETAKKRVTRDFRRGSIFDFFNNIRHEQPFHNRSFCQLIMSIDEISFASPNAITT